MQCKIHTCICSEVKAKVQLTDEEILFKLRNTPKNKWEDLAKEFEFNLKKYRKLLEEEERKKREEIELVSDDPKPGGPEGPEGPDRPWPPYPIIVSRIMQLSATSCPKGKETRVEIQGQTLISDFCHTADVHGSRIWGKLDQKP